jgi:EAL domain-containing protein (putative c-di-GMP-specific phosphodiesterase class I)
LSFDRQKDRALARAPGKPSLKSADPAIDLAHPFGEKPLRGFAWTVALPAFLLYVASAGLVVTVLVLMTADVNRLEDNRDVAAMHAALDSFLNDLSGQVSDEGTWNEAYLNVVINSDAAWMDGTWGATARLGQSYDTVLVTDSQGAIVFAENAAGPLTGNIEKIFPAAATMLHTLDQGILATGDATTVSRFAADSSGAAGLAAISIHQQTATDLPVSQQTRRILWIARHVTPALMQDISARYQTPMAALVATAEPGEQSLPLSDPDGTDIGTLAWTADHPTDAALTRALLLAAAGFIVLGFALIFGLRQMRRSILRRAAAAKQTFVAIEEQGLVPAASAATAATGPVSDEPDAPNALDGVSAGEFDIDYQPIFDLRAETLIGAEVLLRWTRRDKTLLLQETLTAAENIVLLERVGLLAIRRAADELAPLLGLQLTIAITPDQLLNSVFAEKVSATLRATNFPARRLHLCVDTGSLPPAETLRPAIASLRQTGVGIVFGGFALGPATTDYAQRGLADRIRLPQSLIAGIDADPARFALAEATLALAKTLGVDTTIPGVARKEDAAKFLRLGCREFQGPLFAPPMPIAALTQQILNSTARQAS